ncbi:MAG TPA: CPBP family intramembrane glutamic endopeptidase, partial [Nitrospira sp.]
SGDNEAERLQAIEWYEELARTSEDPMVSLQLAIMRGEFGDVSQALLSADEWEKMDEPFPRFADVIRTAYGEGVSTSSDSIDVMQADAAELLPAGWFYDRLAGRLAGRAGNTDLLAVIQRSAGARDDRIFDYSWTLTLVELLVMLVGTLVLLQVWRTRKTIPDLIRLHRIGVPPPWPGGVGAAVLLRGGAIGAVVTAVLLLYMPPENASLRALAIPMTNLPLLWLAYHHLFRPSGMSFNEGFGLDISWTRFGRLTAAVIAVVAAGLWGEWIMDRLSEQWHLTSHWTEWFDADLVWGTPAQTAVSLIEYVVFAPLFEELAFRGLLFAILRRKFRFLPAALISAGIFGIAHGYGLVGLISVCWSGVLWAWIYEKTGSLLPGILAHAINNLLVCLAVMALLR